MALSEKLETGIPIWAEVYKLESLRSRMDGMKADVMMAMQKVLCDEELEPMCELYDYVDAACARISWALAAVNRHLNKELEGKNTVAPPQ